MPRSQHVIIWIMVNYHEMLFERVLIVRKVSGQSGHWIKIPENSVCSLRWWFESQSKIDGENNENWNVKEGKVSEKMEHHKCLHMENRKCINCEILLTFETNSRKWQIKCCWHNSILVQQMLLPEMVCVYDLLCSPPLCCRELSSCFYKLSSHTSKITIFDAIIYAVYFVNCFTLSRQIDAAKFAVHSLQR